ncbi:cation diffusion facilitator family transporter [Saccharopolyspora rosea]|uniref:Cation diffusion facilitator family transporter n=1 Tax=Saccharopolyspora rosea TaxID=524884 RepID=A0ABW3FPG7_9PSEU|nr:cation diffusion facilitator family transporter [Saccharopolyspora rosea]
MAEESRSGSTLTVLVALGINLGIAAMKAVAGVVTGSAAMLSEAGHSVADTCTEVFLLTALRRSRRPADARHPFGYGKERYFWSLIAAISIFVSGAVFAFAEGVRTLAGPAEEQARPLVGYVVLALAFALEAVSWVRAMQQVRAEAAEDGESVIGHLRTSDDPTVKTVLLEDSAALVGLLLAFAGLGLHQLTGSSTWDGVASLAIGALLAAVAYTMARANLGLLIGQQADRRLLSAVRRRLQEQPEVDFVVDVLSMNTGTNRVLFCARIDFSADLDSTELERAVVRIDSMLRTEFDELDEVFLEPVPRNDPEMRARVLARYGRVL